MRVNTSLGRSGWVLVFPCVLCRHLIASSFKLYEVEVSLASGSRCKYLTEEYIVAVLGFEPRVSGYKLCSNLTLNTSDINLWELGDWRGSLVVKSVVLLLQRIAEDSSLVPNSHIGWFATTSNFHAAGSNILFWIPWSPALTYAQTPSIHTNKYMELKIKFEEW